MSHVTRTSTRLQEAFSTIAPQDDTFDVNSGKLALLSDLHRGQGDGADDALACRSNLAAALTHYRDGNYQLGVLGDAEELWEVPQSSWHRIQQTHRASFELERTFVEEGRYFRVFGNHDYPWASGAVAQQFLPQWIGVHTVPESVRIRVTEGMVQLGELYLVHGHQGDFFSETARVVAEPVVQVIWANIQRLSHVRSTPFNAARAVNGRDADIYYDWAVTRRGVVSVMGHTHHMVFEDVAGADQPARVKRLVDKYHARAQNVTQIDLQRHMIKLLRLWTERHQRAVVPGKTFYRPSFFNTGCGCYDKSQVSAIEIHQGRIELAVWLNGTRSMLASASLKEILEYAAQPVPAMSWHAVEIVEPEITN